MQDPRDSAIVKSDQSANQNLSDNDPKNPFFVLRFGIFPGVNAEGFRRPIRQNAFIFRRGR